MKSYPFCLALLLCAATLRAAEPVIPDYSQTERAKVPDDFKFHVNDMFKDDTAWRAEFDAVAKLADSLGDAAKDWTNSPGQVANLLTLVANLNERGERLEAYAKLLGDADLSNPAYVTMQTEYQNFAVGLGARTTFIAPDIIKLGKAKVDAYLKAEPRLAPYKFQLEKILRAKDHTLPEDQAAIVARMGTFTETPGKVSGLLNDVDIPRAEVTLSDGNKVLLNQYNYLIYRISKNQDDRRVIAEAYWNNLRQYENSFAALMDGEMRKQFALARIDKFPTCIEASLFENDISPAVYRNVIKTVSDNLAPLHRLFKFKQRMLGLKEFNYYDIYAPVFANTEKLYSYQDAQKLVLDALAPLGPEYANGLQRAFAEHWIDLYPNKGKQSGAYSMGVFGAHPFIKINYAGRYDDVSVLAHELGHSMHSLFSTTAQPYPTAEYPIFIAEIASTFNENMLLNQALKSNIGDREKLSLLESYLERMRGTIYAQAMFADFELAMHEQAEKGLPLTAAWLKATWLEKFRLYMGVNSGALKDTETVAIQWAGVPHFFRPFYVFTYATGMVASSALAESVSHGGKAEAERYLTMLRAGGSKFALDILRDAGVDLSKPDPIVAAIRQFDHYVAEMETIAARLEKK